MSIDLWVSVLLAIPLAIIANLLTPKIGVWLNRRLESTRHRKKEESHKRRCARAAQIRTELDRIRRFHLERPLLTEYLLFVLLQIAGLGAFASIYGGMLSFVGEFGRWEGALGIIGRSGGQLVTLFVSLLIFQISRRAMATRRRVRDFADYEKETMELISELEKGGPNQPIQANADNRPTSGN